MVYLKPDINIFDIILFNICLKSRFCSDSIHSVQSLLWDDNIYIVLRLKVMTKPASKAKIIIPMHARHIQAYFLRLLISFLSVMKTAIQPITE